MFDKNDPRLTAYALGELDGTQRELVERALAESAELRCELQSIRRTAELLTECFQTEADPVAVPPQRPPLDPLPVTARDNAGASTRRRRTLYVLTTSLSLLVCLSIAAVLVRNSYRRTLEVARSKPDIPRPSNVQEPVESPSVARRAEEGEFQTDPYVPTDPHASRSWDIPLPGKSERLRLLEIENQVSAIDRMRVGGTVQSQIRNPGSSGPSIIDPARGDGPEVFAHKSDLSGAMPGNGYRGMGAVSSATQTSDPEKAAGRFGQNGLGMPGQDLPAMPGMSGAGGRMPGDGRDGYGMPGGVPGRPGGGRSSNSGFGGAGTGVERGGLEGGRVGSGNVPGGDLGGVAGGKNWFDASRPVIATSDGGIDSKLSTRLPGLKASGDQPPAERPVTWRPAKATPNASRLMIGDRDGLPLEGIQANVVVDGFRARVLLDLYFFNNYPQRLEGNFQLRLPNDASLDYFAFGESAYEYRPQVDQLASKGFLSAELVRASGLGPTGILRAREGSWSNVKEAKLVARDKAAHAYGETVRRRVDPALVEWSGAGVFNARVFPLAPNKLHRVVVGYDVTLQSSGSDLVYQLELPEDARQCLVDVNVAAQPGARVEVNPPAKPFTSGGRAYYQFAEHAARRIELRQLAVGPTLLSGHDLATRDSYFAARFTPALASEVEQTGSSTAIFLLDTSLSSRPDKFHVWLQLLEKVLTRNRDSIREFAVLAFNIESHWWKDGFTANTQENVNELMAYCHTLSLEGATDLRQALLEATAPGWRNKDRKAIPSPDLFLLSDGGVTWGEFNVHRIGESLHRGWGGTLFAYKTGLAGTASDVLEYLARDSGGAVFSITSEAEVGAAAMAHRVRPWKLIELNVPGGSDVLVAGRPQFIYPGQPLMIVGRGKPGASATLRVARGEQRHEVEIRFDQNVPSELAARAYGQVAVGQLEDLGNNLEDVAVAFARHFRVTGQTCSLLMLESEADYQRFRIKPEDDAFVVRSTPTAELIVRKLDELSQRLGDAKAALLAWLSKLEGTPGLQFKTPPALRMAMERLPREVFEIDTPRLVCRQRDRVSVPKEFDLKLDAAGLDYDLITSEAARRRTSLGAADALKVLSSLIENNPGDPVLARDVAFAALEWGLGGQAYFLMQRVAQIRPFEPQSYQSLAQCLSELGAADLALIYYEVALQGTWNTRYQDFQRIAGLEYLHLLRRIDAGQLKCHSVEYARARLESLAPQMSVDHADLVVVMMWNTDRTDVDLHVVEPSGEECFYSHPRTQSGGTITADVTEGYGPEMYVLPEAKPGAYQIKAKYFRGDANRTQVRSKVYVTLYEKFGHPTQERKHTKSVSLGDRSDTQDVLNITIGK